MFLAKRDADWVSERGREVGDWCVVGVVGSSTWVDGSWWVGVSKLAGIESYYSTLSFMDTKIGPNKILFFSSKFIFIFYFSCPFWGGVQRREILFC